MNFEGTPLFNNSHLSGNVDFQEEITSKIASELSKEVSSAFLNPKIKFEILDESELELKNIKVADKSVKLSVKQISNEEVYVFVRFNPQKAMRFVFNSDDLILKVFKSHPDLAIIHCVNVINKSRNFSSTYVLSKLIKLIYETTLDPATITQPLEGLENSRYAKALKEMLVLLALSEMKKSP